MAVEGGPHRRAGRIYSGAAGASRARTVRVPTTSHGATSSAITSNHTYPLATPLGGFPCGDPEARAAAVAQRHDADRRPVQLERRDDDEHRRRTPRESATARGMRRAAARTIAPATSSRGSTVSPASPQRDEPTAATRDEPPRPDDRSEREPAQIDEPVRRRDEERQVVQPVAVDAPDERARRPRATVAKRTTPITCARTIVRERPDRRDSTSQVTHAEHELHVEPDLRVDREQHREIRRACRGVPARDGHRRYWSVAPARRRQQLEQRAPAVRVVVGELRRVVVPADLELPFLHAVVEPGAAEHELLAASRRAPRRRRGRPRSQWRTR